MKKCVTFKTVKVEKQKITLSLPKALVKKAKIIAAIEEKSLSELLRETLEEKIENSSAYGARMRQLRYLKKGFNFGTKGEESIPREALHERLRSIQRICKTDLRSAI